MRYAWIPILALCLVVGCGPTTKITQTEFEVLRVIDGDTFVVMYDGEETSVRLADYDAPEPREEGGQEAKAELERLILGRVVTLEFPGPRKRDHFGRLFARAYLGGNPVTMALPSPSVVSQKPSSPAPPSPSMKEPAIGQSLSFGPSGDRVRASWGAFVPPASSRIML